MAARVIVDDARFRALWDSDLTAEEIGDLYGVTLNAVSHAARRYGLPPRRPGRVAGRRAPVAPVPDVPDAPDADSAGAAARDLMARLERARVTRAVPVPPFWTQARDWSVIEAGGAYARLAELAARWGVAFSRVLARWHVLRAVVR